MYCYIRDAVIRPALSFSLVQNIHLNIVCNNGVKEVLYGEYPQYAVDDDLQKILEREFSRNTLFRTRKNYTFDSMRYNDYNTGFSPTFCAEYVYNDEKYIRIKANNSFVKNSFTLSNTIKYNYNDFVWVKVEPVVWMLDEKAQTLVSKYGLLSGIRFHENRTQYNGDFNITEMKWYLDTYMSKELFNTEVLTNQENNELKEAMLKLKRRIQKY